MVFGVAELDNRPEDGGALGLKGVDHASMSGLKAMVVGPGFGPADTWSGELIVPSSFR